MPARTSTASMSEARLGRKKHFLPKPLHCFLSVGCRLPEIEVGPGEDTSSPALPVRRQPGHPRQHRMDGRGILAAEPGGQGRRMQRQHRAEQRHRAVQRRGEFADHAPGPSTTWRCAWSAACSASPPSSAPAARRRGRCRRRWRPARPPAPGRARPSPPAPSPRPRPGCGWRPAGWRRISSACRCRRRRHCARHGRSRRRRAERLDRRGLAAGIDHEVARHRLRAGAGERAVQQRVARRRAARPRPPACPRA